MWVKQLVLVGNLAEGPYPAPSAPWASTGHSRVWGDSSLDLGCLSLAQTHTFRKMDLRSCLRKTMKHISSLMSSSSKIKPCSLAQQKALDDSIYFLFELYELCWIREKCVVLQGRRNCWTCIKGVTEPWYPQHCNSQSFIFLQENWSQFCYCSCQSTPRQEPKSQLFSSNTGEERMHRERNVFILFVQNIRSILCPEWNLHL